MTKTPKITEMRNAQALDDGERIYFEIETDSGQSIPLVCETPDLEKMVYFLIQSAQAATVALAKAGKAKKAQDGPMQGSALTNVSVGIGETTDRTSGMLTVDLIAFRLNVLCSPGQLRQIAEMAKSVSQKLDASPASRH